MDDGDLGRRQLWLAFVAILLLFAAASITFARAQNIWIDESTQLSGMTLSPGPLMAWLLNKYHPGFGVPGDRMPPVSYLIDHGGWMIWGVNVMATRLLHGVIAGAGLLILMMAMARRYGGRAAIVTGLVIALSPRVIDIAIEIRAYPIFFAISCAQVAMILRGSVTHNPRRLLMFLLLGLVSGYVHFFGVIATSAFFLAALIDAPSWRAAIVAVAGYVMLFLLWMGLIPLILSAAAVSNVEAPSSQGLIEIITFAFQQLGHSSMMVNPLVAMVYFAGVALVALPALVGLVFIARARGLALRHEPAFGLIVALFAGMGVCVLAGFVLRGFSTISPRYSIWTMPALAALIGVACTGIFSAPGRVSRVVRMFGIGLLAIGALSSAYMFMSRAEWFIHGPSRTLEAMIARAGPNVAVVYNGPEWAFGYYPLYWRHRDALPQWLMSDDGSQVVRIAKKGTVTGKSEPVAALAAYPKLLVVSIRLHRYGDVRALLALQPQVVDSGPDFAESVGGADWRLRDTVYQPGIYALTGQLYEKDPTP